MSFSFVNRITEIVPGIRVRGYSTIPRDFPDLFAGLLVEAVGQLAAWAAMSKLDFRTRPVAGIIGEVKIFNTAVPATILDLEANIESCETDAVAYNGRAYTGDQPIIELTRGVGPMLPMEDFNDPDDVRQQFQSLCEAEVPPRGLSSDALRNPDLVPIDRDPGRRLRAKMWVPKSAPYFPDHFPRKPVFPGTLLLNALVQLGVSLASEAFDPSMRTLVKPTRVSNIKLRSFVHPGQLIEMGVKILSASQTSAEIALAAEVEGQRVGSARLETGVRGTS